ncbi:hypothetical protein [Roseovarius sp.]|uniref:hypothetical protein n=1 Tax=Roseovarius sp. TaxID=1486281 RepID=UPI003B5AA836
MNLLQSFPKLPYHRIRDDRPKRISDHKTLVGIVDSATELRAKVSYVDDPVCLLSILQFEFPKLGNWTADDRHFLDLEGRPVDKRLEAFCDFRKGREVFLREWVFEAIVEGYAVHGEAFFKASESLGHEFGHVFTQNHKSKIAARNRGCEGSTNKRVAHNRVVDRAKDWLKVNTENADLEEEADIFCYALHVPVAKLRDSPNLKQVAEKYNINSEMAYQCALLAKDYYRAQAVLSK